MSEIAIRQEIIKAAEWLGASPELMDSLRDARKRQIYEAFESMGADRELLGIIGSWLDTWSDVQVFLALRAWNAGAAADALENVRQGRQAMLPAAKS